MRSYAFILAVLAVAAAPLAAASKDTVRPAVADDPIAISTAAAPAPLPALPEGTTAVLDAAHVWRKAENRAFGAPEKLKFAVRWQFVTVGAATMEIIGPEDLSGRKAYHIVSTANSSPFFDSFYKVRDVNESWMDVESLCSLKFSSRISEGGSKRNEIIVFDHARRQIMINDKPHDKPAPLWVQDILSSLYYVRTMDLTVGKNVQVDVQSGDKSWPLNVKVLRKERVRVPAGEFECIVVEPEIRDGAGIFKAKGKLWIWLTADDRKIPVFMRSKIPVGSIEALLTEINK